MLVGQFLDAVIIGVEPQAQHPQHQDLPLRHAGATGVDADGLARRVQGDDLAEHREHRLADLGLRINVLQATQQARNVVARAGVQLHGGNVHDTAGLIAA